MNEQDLVNKLMWAIRKENDRAKTKLTAFGVTTEEKEVIVAYHEGKKVAYKHVVRILKGIDQDLEN